MNIAQKGFDLVEDALDSIGSVIKDWEKFDENIKSEYLPRVNRLKKWKNELERWKTTFSKADPKRRSQLMAKLH